MYPLIYSIEMRWLHEPVASFPFLFWSYCFLKSLRLVENQAMHIIEELKNTQRHCNPLLPSCKGVSWILSSSHQGRTSSSLEVPQVPQKSWPGRKAVSRTLRGGASGSLLLELFSGIGQCPLWCWRTVQGWSRWRLREPLLLHLLRRRIYHPALADCVYATLFVCVNWLCTVFFWVCEYEVVRVTYVSGEGV